MSSILFPELIASLFILLFAVVIHEYSHGFVALKLGDTTARDMGRLTLNPLAHVDPFGTVLLPLLLVMINAPFVFGWAKPVPINFLNLRKPFRDMVWVGIAGPLSNLAVAFALAYIYKSFPGLHTKFGNFVFMNFILINLVLAVFNFIPVPPLDGSRILMGIMPKRAAYYYSQLEPYGILILIALFYLGLLNRVVWPVVLYLLGILM